MNILVLTELFYPHGSGGELATYLYSKLLSKEGHKVVVITNKFSGESSFSKYENIEIFRLHLFNGNNYNKYLGLRRVDVLLSNFVNKMLKWSNIVYIPKSWYSAILLAKLYGKPVVVHLHGYDPICPTANNYNLVTNDFCVSKNRFCSPRCIGLYEKNQRRNTLEVIASIALNFTVGNLFYKSIKLSDAVICVSAAQRNVMSDCFPDLRSKLHLIYNPLPDLDYVNLTGDDFAYFGGPSILKGYSVLCNALNKISGQIIRVNATNFPDYSLRPVCFSNGSVIRKYMRVSPKEFRNIYCLSRAVIVPSIWQEPAPYVVYEALLRGRIVISSSVGGMPEQVNGYPGCFLFPPGDAGKLSELLEYVSSLDRFTVEELGCANRERLIKERQTETSTSSIIGVMSSLL